MQYKRSNNNWSHSRTCCIWDETLIMRVFLQGSLAIASNLLLPQALRVPDLSWAWGMRGGGWDDRWTTHTLRCTSPVGWKSKCLVHSLCVNRRYSKQIKAKARLRKAEQACFKTIRRRKQTLRAMKAIHRPRVNCVDSSSAFWYIWKRTYKKFYDLIHIPNIMLWMIFPSLFI